jgi:hypothetical protein
MQMQQAASIQSQVDVIKRATQIASKSKETALKFLIDAGIVKKENTKSSTASKSNK